MAGAESKKRKRPDEVEQGGQDDCHSSSKLISLNSSDGKVFKIEEDVALQFGTLKPLLDDESSDINSIISAPPNIDSNILSKVVDYCKKHAEKDVDLKPFDRDFLQGMDQDVLFRITQAAHYFEIESLLDLTSHEIARLIKGMTVGKVRKFFNIINDIPFEVENNFHKEFAWAFENLDDSAPQEVQPGQDISPKRCFSCNWPFPNHHPSKKSRNSHTKVCGTLEGYPVVDHSDATAKDDGEGCEKLLYDIQFEVLKRLPVKALIRFMITCKTWNEHITSSKFMSEYQQNRLGNRVLVSYGKASSSGLFEIKFISIWDDDSFPARKHSMTLPINDASIIVGSVSGLFCFADYADHNTDSLVVVLWNPTTRQSISIRGATAVEKYPQTTFFLGFGVCSQTNDPKILTVSAEDSLLPRMRSNILVEFDTLRDRAQIYSLSNRVWRKPLGKLDLPYKKIYIDFTQRVFTSEFMYFLAHETRPSDRYLIISFDITREQFSEVCLPPHLADRNNGKNELSLSKRGDSLILKKWDAQTKKDDVYLIENDDPNAITKLFTITLDRPGRSKLLTFRVSGEAMIQREDSVHFDEVYSYEHESQQLKSVGIGRELDLFSSNYIEPNHRCPVFASSYCETLSLIEQASKGQAK